MLNWLANILGLKRYAWYRKRCGGEWWFCLYLYEFGVWERPGVFQGMHIGQKCVLHIENYDVPTESVEGVW